MDRERLNRRAFLQTQAVALTLGGASLAAAGQGSRSPRPVGSENAPARGESSDSHQPTGAYREPARDIPITSRADVVVCGGGPAGVAAAVAAARSGARVRLIELGGCLGGIWTAGLMSYVLDGGNKPGLMQEILQRVADRDACRFRSLCEPESMKLVLEEMCAEAGVEIRLHTRCTAAVRQERRLALVLTESPSGREAVAGSVFIDTTGGGDVAAAARCGWDYGRPDTDEAQPMSFIVVLTGPKVAEIEPYVSMLPGVSWAGPKDLLAKKIEEASRHAPSYSKPTLFPVRDDLYILMANHEYGVKGFNADDLTRATLRGRAELHRMIDGLRALGEPWTKLRIVATPSHIGVREGRRIHGLYTITADDIARGARFDDAVCRCTFGVDVHSTNPDRDKGIDNRGVRSRPYDIPMRSLVARDVDGLLMAGRCISGDFYAHASYRVTGNAVATGEASGAAAALAARTGRSPHELPWPEVNEAIEAVRKSRSEALS